MVTAAESRRIAKLMQTEVIVNLLPSRRVRFAHAIDVAPSLDAAPAWVRSLVKAAETETRRGGDGEKKALAFEEPDDAAPVEHSIVQVNGEYCVVGQDKKRKFGCYPSKEAAEKRLSQIEMFKHMKPAAKALAFVEDYNPYHDARGRFASANATQVYVPKGSKGYRLDTYEQPAGPSATGTPALSADQNAVRAKIPKLAPLIDAGKLTIKGWSSKEAKLALQELTLLPDKIRDRLVQAGVTWEIGDQPMTGLDKNEAYKGVTPRGWEESGKTWDDVPGCYQPHEKQVVWGVGQHGSVSGVLHETGHAIESELKDRGGTRWGESSGLAAHHERLYPKLPPYLRQGGPRGTAGMEELIAEAIATRFKVGKHAVVGMWDKPFADWLDREVLA